MLDILKLVRTAKWMVVAEADRYSVLQVDSAYAYYVQPFIVSYTGGRNE